MKILQWSMTIPQENQEAFIKCFTESLGPVLGGFGAIGHELYKVADKKLIGRQQVESDRFIERIFFDNDFDVSDYFANVKADSRANELSQSYEKDFGAYDIELRVLVSTDKRG